MALFFLVFSAFWTKMWNRFAYIYMTYLRILVAQLLFHDEVYLLSSLSIWRKAFGGSCFFSLPGGHDGGAAWKVRFGGAFSRRIFSWWMMIPYDWFDLYMVTCGDVINDPWLIRLDLFIIVCRISSVIIEFNNNIWHLPGDVGSRVGGFPGLFAR